MSVQTSYFDRLWTLAAHGRSTGRNSVAEALPDRLEADFAGNKELFSAEEYKDPAFSDALLGLLVASWGGFFVPKEVTSFVKAILGPGRVLSLYSGLGEFLSQFRSGIGIERQSVAAKWSQFLIRISAVDAHVVNEDPLHWESDEKFERIVCNPPFGSHDGEFKAIERALSSLDKNGQLAAIVSPNFLWGSRQSRMREMISKSARLRAIVSLPPNVFAHTSIRSAILVLQKEAAGKTYMASSKSVADLGAIAEDYAAWRRGQRFSLGFEVDLDSSRWDVSYHEPVDFGLGAVPFPYKVVPLGEVAQIDAGKRSDAARIAINRTGSKVIWLEDAPDDLIVKNNIFVAPQGNVNPLYVHFYLSSSLGKRALAKRITGATIPHISPKDLAGLPVVVPELRQQGKIVEQALKIRQITAALEALAFEGQQSLSDRFFNLEAVSDKFLKFSENTEKAFYQRLPFPIAVVYRKIANAANNTQRYSLLIELFEVVIRFIVLVNLADYLNSRKAAETLVQRKRLTNPPVRGARFCVEVSG